MKICFVIDNFNIGGASILSLEIINYLAQENHEVGIVILDPDNVDKNLEDSISSKTIKHKLNFSKLTLFKKFSNLRKILSDYEIVHSCLEASNFYSSMVSYSFSRDKIFVSTIHGIDGVFIDDKLLKDKIKSGWSKKYVISIKYIQNILFKKYSLFIAVSKNTKEFLVSLRKISPSKIKVIYHGINLQLLKNVDPGHLLKAKQKIEKSESDFVIGYVGRLSYGKGLENLLISFSNLSKVYSNIKLILVGDGELKEQLENFMLEKGLSNRCIITGFVSESKSFYELIDLFVLPSSSEGIPLTLLEAMYMKKVSVCSDVGGIPEVIADNQNGYLFKKNDFAKFEEILEFVINNHDTLNYIGENAKKTIVRNFDLRKNIHLIEKELLSLLEKKD